MEEGRVRDIRSNRGIGRNRCWNHPFVACIGMFFRWGRWRVYTFLLQAMLFNANFVVLATLLAAGVHAQTPTTTGSASAPTSTSQVPPCVLDCAEAALKATNGACTSLSVFFLCQFVQLLTCFQYGSMYLYQPGVPDLCRGLLAEKVLCCRSSGRPPDQSRTLR